MDTCKTALPDLEFVEVMVINACNLSCAGCTTFSDLKHKGYVGWARGQEWLRSWQQRVNIKAVGLMGGEPLMNPELEHWLRGIRELLPDAQIRFVTNGLLLHKHWWILDLLDELGHAVFKISQHVDTDHMQQVISTVMNSRDWQPIREHGIDRWVSESGLRLQLARPVRFVKTFRGDYAAAQPHHSDPAQAFGMCVQKRCPLLLDGRLWKCGTAALTPRMLARFGWPNREAWQPYMHDGLAADCGDQELLAFLQNFGRPHDMCRQCPSPQDQDSVLDHAHTVRFK